jgi:hydrogenase maturation protease
MSRSPTSKRGDDFLIIGYGNTLRSDDGAGPRVAEAVAAMNYPGVRVLVCPLLTPELADPISQAGAALFVDAAVDAPREVRWRKLEPAESAQIMAHAADPRTLLALARDVFGHAPRAWWLTIPAVKFDFGDELSPEAQRGFARALQEIERLCGPGRAVQPLGQRRYDAGRLRDEVIARKRFGPWCRNGRRFRPASPRPQ